MHKRLIISLAKTQINALENLERTEDVSQRISAMEIVLSKATNAEKLLAEDLSYLRAELSEALDKTVDSFKQLSDIDDKNGMAMMIAQMNAVDNLISAIDEDKLLLVNGEYVNVVRTENQDRYINSLREEVINLANKQKRSHTIH